MFYKECKSVEDLLTHVEYLTRRQMDASWFFRGQANSTWGLQPSIFRSRAGVADPQQFERDTIDRIRRLNEEATMVPERYLGEDYFLALAQHYGTPTRLLDYTLDPDVALYFAVSSALRQNPLPAKCSVFAVSTFYFTDSLVTPGKIVKVPQAANPNLVAQRGALVRQEWGNQHLWDWSPAVADEHPTQNPTGDFKRRLLRFDLPTTEIPQAFTVLVRRGLRGSILFPGEAGIAYDAEDYARLSAYQNSTLTSPSTQH